MSETVSTHYYAQLGLPNKNRSIKGLVVYNGWDLCIAFGPAKRSVPRLLLTVLCTYIFIITGTTPKIILCTLLHNQFMIWKPINQKVS